MTRIVEPAVGLQLLFVALAFVLTLSTSANAATQADPPDQPEPSNQPDLQPTGEALNAKLTDYFTAPSGADRRDIAREIESMSGVTIDTVGAALHQTPLWKPLTVEGQILRIECPRGPRKTPCVTKVHVRIPKNYDPAAPYPLVLALHGMGGDGEQYLKFAEQLLGDDVNDFLIAAPTNYAGVWLGSEFAESYDVPTILGELKRAYHVDSDRVYVTGYSLGGHASFVAAALYGDYFAASVPLAGTFVTQAGWEAVELLLGNLRGTPVLAVYGELDRNDRGGDPDDDKPGADETSNENSGISGSNRHLARMLKRIDAPVELIELPGVGHLGVEPPRDRFLTQLSVTRPHDRKTVQQWFRYPPQGRAGWLRQTEFDGRMWRSQQLVIQPAANETYSEAMTRALIERLAFISGKIEGQTVRIATQKCAKVELLLNNDLIDLTQPITIIMNGTRRFEGVATPRISTLLEMAHRDHDFDRLWSVRFEISEAGRALEP